MILKGLLFVIFIIISGIALLVSFIFFVIRLFNDHPKKWNASIAVGISLVALVVSIVVFVRKVVTKATELGQQIEQKVERTMEDAALHNKQDYHYELLDSGRNKTIARLKAFDAQNGNENIPDEFYVYLGFMDYYRMPLYYPYSLHCNDVLETASLFNEAHVTEFNKSDNSETDCNVNFVNEFAFDNRVLIAKQKFSDGEKFTVYNFDNSTQKTFGSLKDAFSEAEKLKYTGPDTLITVLQYYRQLNP